MSQLAWLNAIPKESKISRYESILKSSSDADIDKLLPDINDFSYLVKWLSDLNFGINTGFGLSSLSYVEIYTFGKALDITLWESKQIKMLSNLYCNKISEFKDPNSIRPYIKDIDDEERKNISNKIKSVFSRLKKKG